MLKDEVLDIIEGRKPLTDDWVEQMSLQHPYFVLPLLLYLKQHGIEGNDDLLARLATAWPNRTDLAMQLGKNAETFASFYPPEAQPVTPDTVTTIDRFLDNYGTTSQKEIDAISNAIFNPTPDYADVLAAQERKEHAKRPAPAAAAQTTEDQLISNFIEQSRVKERQAAASTPAAQHVAPADAAEIASQPIAQPQEKDDSTLSESLAKMYVGQGKYAKALEIIESINLKFPEKSIYFADQIRFLRKLVLNQKLTKQQ